MTPDEIKAVVLTAMREGLAFHWWAYLIAALLALGSFFLGGFATRKGENLATKADFDALLTQVKQTTLATEKIRAEISAISDERRFRFTQLHGKVFDTIAELYRLVDRALCSLNEFIRARPESQYDRLQKTATAMNELLHFFSEHELYFSDEICNRMNSLLTEVREVFMLLSLRANCADEGQILEAEDRAIRKMIEVIGPIKEHLKKAFRLNIGARTDEAVMHSA